MRFRPYPVMTVFALVGLIVLIMLGNWQWARYQDKTDAVTTPALDWQIADITPTGAPAQFVYSTFSGQPVWRVIVPVAGRVGGNPGSLEAPQGQLFLASGIQIGTEPDLARDMANASISDDLRYLAGPGRTRNMIAPAHQPDQRRWYSTDLVAMQSALGLDATGQPILLEPETIAFVDNAQPTREPVLRPNPYADPAAAEDLPPARHLGYALTWWGLALGLIAIYLGFHYSRGRLRFSGAAQS